MGVLNQPRFGFTPTPRSYLRSLKGWWKERNHFKNVNKYCMFIGYPRSGHTLIGSLLNAHPEMVIANELDALSFIEKGFTRNQLFWLIVDRARWFAKRRHMWEGYSYAVPNQWQGKFKTLRVIGDKKAAKSALRLRDDPALMDRLQRVVKFPIYIIHVVRNPFDNITTMTRKGNGELFPKAKFYFENCEIVRNLQNNWPEDRFLTVHSEDFIEDPKSELQRMCGFLGLDTPEDYLEDCMSIVFQSPRKTREKIEWPEKMIQEVVRRKNEFEYLKDYTFEGR